MSIRPRLSLSSRGLGASVTIGPLRITRSGAGRFSLGLALPWGRRRGRTSSGAVTPGAVPATGPALDRFYAAARRAQAGQWAPPQGPRLQGPRS